MKKLLVSISILAALPLLTSCGIGEVTYVPEYTGAYVAPIGFYTTTPAWNYAGYGYENWYAGTPDYYNTSIYVGNW